MLDLNDTLNEIRNLLKQKNYIYYDKIGRNEVYLLSKFNEINEK